jgi:hypothetical protein
MQSRPVTLRPPHQPTRRVAAVRMRRMCPICLMGRSAAAMTARLALALAVLADNVSFVVSALLVGNLVGLAMFLWLQSFRRRP